MKETLMREITQENSAWVEPQRHFPDALSFFNRGDLDYLPRLEMLQAWLARISDGDAVRGEREEVEGAIIALQSPLKLKMVTLEEYNLWSCREVQLSAVCPLQCACSITPTFPLNGWHLAQLSARPFHEFATSPRWSAGSDNKMAHSAVVRGGTRVRLHGFDDKDFASEIC